MDFYSSMAAVRSVAPAADLSTGEPLLVDGLAEILRDALDVAVGEPRLIQRLAAYTELDGTRELRAVLGEVLAAAFGRSVHEEEILIVPGAQAALRYVQALVHADGRRLLFPVGLEFPGAFDTRGPEPAVGLALWTVGDAGDLRAELDLASLKWDGVGAVVLSRPHSPTGRVWPAAELAVLAADAERHGALLVLDETYGLPRLALQDAPLDPFDALNVVHVLSFSKVGLAGERLGAVIAGEPVVRRLRDELRRATISAPHLAQLVAARLLCEPRATEVQAKLAAAYRERWSLLRRGLTPLLETGLLRLARWEGGPFAWLWWEGEPSSDDVFLSLLAAGVGVTPGSALHPVGAEVSGLRLGIGCDTALLEAACATVADVLESALGTNSRRALYPIKRA